MASIPVTGVKLSPGHLVTASELRIARFGAEEDAAGFKVEPAVALPLHAEAVDVAQRLFETVALV